MLHHPVEAYFYRMGRRSDERKEMELVELLHSKNEEPPHLSLSRHEERRTSLSSTFSAERMDEEPPWYNAIIAPPPPTFSPPEGLEMMPASFPEKA